jgi:hypothetical protein
MPIIKRQFATYHEWVDTDNQNKLESPDFWTPAYEHYASKLKIWCRNGQEHREYDYPAYVIEGLRKEWSIRGYRYRLPANGPAIEFEITDPNDPMYTEDEYWLWNRRCDENGVILPDQDDIPVPEWVYWEGFLSDAELGYEKTLPDWFPPEPTNDSSEATEA